MKTIFGTILTALTLSAAAQSQAPLVSARLEPDSVAVGDRFDCIIEVDKDLVQVVVFPTFRMPESGSDEPAEIVADYPVDTLERDGRRLRLRKRYTMQAFGEGTIDMGSPGVLYIDKNITDTLYGQERLTLRVSSFEIDSTSMPIMTLKPQKNMPFRFGEIAGYLLRGFIILILLCAVALAIVLILRHYGRSVKDLFRPAPPVPPHVAAIKALEELHHRKLWQNGKHKLYYSSLTDILRTYIAGRYGVSAMEMTSDEIIRAARELDLSQKCMMDLTGILRDADLVKFAKAEPEAEQNENDYLRAYYFVEETKEVELEPGEADETAVEIDG
ncbi:MAG: hypothetical protein J1D86_08095 [Alistipes sp.]|nr:hypothetical protein [Alistipes sp.]